MPIRTSAISPRPEQTQSHSVALTATDEHNASAHFLWFDSRVSQRLFLPFSFFGLALPGEIIPHPRDLIVRVIFMAARARACLISRDLNARALTAWRYLHSRACVIALSNCACSLHCLILIRADSCIWPRCESYAHPTRVNSRLPGARGHDRAFATHASTRASVGRSSSYSWPDGLRVQPGVS